MVWTQLMLDTLTCLQTRVRVGWWFRFLSYHPQHKLQKHNLQQDLITSPKVAKEARPILSEVDRSIPFSNPAAHLYSAWLRYTFKITLYLCKFHFYYFFSFLKSNIQFIFSLFFYIFLCLIQLKLFSCVSHGNIIYCCIQGNL